jgi:subtilisin family serine protease
VDDDLNGFIDDVHGWDFISIPSDGVMPGEDYADPDNDPNDMAGHGTAVAGVIAAHTNNGVGGAGTAWQARIMPLRIGWSAQGNSLGLVDMGAVSQALLYAARMRVNVVNCSFATLNQPSLVEATNAALRSGVVIVFAAGNGGQPHDIATLPNVIAVGATHHDDAVTGFSNRGDYVDLSAPGIDILTTFVQPTGSDSIGLRQPDYVAAIGTSFSSPMVAGAVVLMQAQRRAQGLPLATPPNAQLRLRETTEDISAENPGGTGYGTGRLDLTRLLTARPTSTAARTFAFTTGPGVVIPSPGATPRVAYVTTNRRFLVISGQSTDTLVNVALPAFPLTRLGSTALRIVRVARQRPYRGLR